MNLFTKISKYILQRLKYYRLLFRTSYDFQGINLCSGPQKIPNCLAIDFNLSADLYLDLRRQNLPFARESLDYVVCISAINYLSYERASEIVDQVYRALKQGGVVRFGVQDLKLIALKYLEKDLDFFYQKLPDGQQRFPGDTLGDKFNYWFYGHPIRGSGCKYLYDYESLENIFLKAGFSVVENRKFMDSRLRYIELIDNRQDQMFFLEAVK